MAVSIEGVPGLVGFTTYDIGGRPEAREWSPACRLRRHASAGDPQPARRFQHRRAVR